MLTPLAALAPWTRASRFTKAAPALYFCPGPDGLWQQLKHAGGGTCGSRRPGQGRAQERLKAGRAEFPHSSHHRKGSRRRRGGWVGGWWPGSLLLVVPGRRAPGSVYSRSAGHVLKNTHQLSLPPLKQLPTSAFSPFPNSAPMSPTLSLSLFLSFSLGLSSPVCFPPSL